MDSAAEVDEEDDCTPAREESGGGDTVQNAVKPRRYVAPSAVGFSFFARGKDIQFHVRCSSAK